MSLGAMTSVPEQVDDRIIFYRHSDANFYGAFSYTFGKAASLLPQSLCDVLIFGTICYFMVGLTTAASNYFIYIATLFVFSFVMNQQLAIFTAVAENKSGVQAASSVILLFFVVFCGFLVVPEVIPNYYIWIYWWNPLAWAYRALLVNEFSSSDYDETYLATNARVGDVILKAGGMIYKGSAFSQVWIGYAFAYMVPYAILCTLAQSLCLKLVRVEPRASPAPPEDGNGIVENEDGTENADMQNVFVKLFRVGPKASLSSPENAAMEIPFKPVTLTFTDICYDVKASKGKDTIRLLNNVNGIFQAGRMCALMGSSGVSLPIFAAKTICLSFSHESSVMSVAPGRKDDTHGTHFEFGKVLCICLYMLNAFIYGALLLLYSGCHCFAQDNRHNTWRCSVEWI